jgi:uncharacterized membrane protein
MCIAVMAVVMVVVVVVVVVVVYGGQWWRSQWWFYGGIGDDDGGVVREIQHTIRSLPLFCFFTETKTNKRGSSDGGDNRAQAEQQQTGICCRFGRSAAETYRLAFRSHDA